MVAALTKSTTPEAIRDTLQTPWPIFHRIQQVTGLQFQHDVCAAKATAKCSSFWHRGHNALSKRWADYFPPLTPLWMNPPYSDPRPWVEKAAEAAADGLIVVGLIPNITSSTWYPEYVEGRASTLLHPDGRISFCTPAGKLISGNPWPSVVPIWTPWQVKVPAVGRFERPKRGDER